MSEKPVFGLHFFPMKPEILYVYLTNTDDPITVKEDNGEFTYYLNGGYTVKLKIMEKTDNTVKIVCTFTSGQQVSDTEEETDIVLPCNECIKIAAKFQEYSEEWGTVAKKLLRIFDSWELKAEDVVMAALMVSFSYLFRMTDKENFEDTLKWYIGALTVATSSYIHYATHQFGPEIAEIVKKVSSEVKQY